MSASVSRPALAASRQHRLSTLAYPYRSQDDAALDLQLTAARSAPDLTALQHPGTSAFAGPLPTTSAPAGAGAGASIPALQSPPQFPSSPAANDNDDAALLSVSPEAEHPPPACDVCFVRADRLTGAEPPSLLLAERTSKIASAPASPLRGGRNAAAPHASSPLAQCDSAACPSVPLQEIAIQGAATTTGREAATPPSVSLRGALPLPACAPMPSCSAAAQTPLLCPIGSASSVLARPDDTPSFIAEAPMSYRQNILAETNSVPVVLSCPSESTGAPTTLAPPSELARGAATVLAAAASASAAAKATPVTRTTVPLGDAVAPPRASPTPAAPSPASPAQAPSAAVPAGVDLARLPSDVTLYMSGTLRLNALSSDRDLSLFTLLERALGRAATSALLSKAEPISAHPAGSQAPPALSAMGSSSLSAASSRSLTPTPPASVPLDASPPAGATATTSPSPYPDVIDPVAAVPNPSQPARASPPPTISPPPPTLAPIAARAPPAALPVPTAPPPYLPTAVRLALEVPADPARPAAPAPPAPSGAASGVPQPDPPPAYSSVEVGLGPAGPAQPTAGAAPLSEPASRQQPRRFFWARSKPSPAPTPSSGAATAAEGTDETAGGSLLGAHLGSIPGVKHAVPLSAPPQAQLDESALTSVTAPGDGKSRQPARRVPPAESALEVLLGPEQLMPHGLVSVRVHFQDIATASRALWERVCRYCDFDHNGSELFCVWLTAE